MYIGCLMLTAQPAHASHKFKVHRTITGDITLLAMHGVIDEGFEAKKTAETIRTKNVVLNLRDVRRFASWGMAEWTELMRLIAARDVYIVECSTHALGQFNLVTGLISHGKLVSFYIPYRCSKCGEESDSLMVVPIDRETMLRIADSKVPCAACGGVARTDKYTSSMCETMAERPAFDIEDEVVAFLRSELKYSIEPDLSRFRAYRRANKRYTYLRLSGNLAGLNPELVAQASERTTVVDLAGVQMDPAAATQWRGYIDRALPKLTSLQLLDCTAGFLRETVEPADLPKLKVRTFTLFYDCENCNATTARSVDVAQNLEYLVEGVIPAARCDTCKAMLEATVPPDLAVLIRSLPVREHDANLDKFLAKARAEPPDKLENALIARPEKPARAAASIPRGLYVAVGLAALLTAGLVVLGFTLWRDHDRKVVAVKDPNPVIAPKPHPTFQRPDWIVSDLPASAFCQDLINRVMCVGVSSYRPNRNEAAVDASDAALDELVNTLALRVTDPFFRDNVLSAYAETRAKALGTLQAVDLDRTSAAYAQANEVVRTARKRVVEILQATGGPAVPAQRSDWYWEEYAVEKGTGTEVLVFVRYDVALDAIKALVERYSASVSVADTTALTAFPALAWRQPDFAGGAMLVKVSRRLVDAGAGPTQVVTAINDQRIVDAQGFEKLVRQTGQLTLTVRAGNGPPKQIQLLP